jgi:preprotein translocase subunit YajC
VWVLIVLAVLIGLFVLLALGLCVPIDAVFEWDSTQLPRTRLRLVWLFGLISFALGKPARAKAQPTREKNARRSPSLTKIWKIITIEGLFGKVAALVKSSFQQIRIEDIEGDIKVELDDPADAGFVYAILGATYPIFRSTQLSRVNIEPVFGEQIAIQGNARAVFRLQPIRLAGPLLKFFFSRPAFSAMRTAIAD